jgi:DNA-binding NarL/FixJ family response regulator
MTRSGPDERTSSVTESRPVRVFVVDDHELIRRGVHDLLDADPDIDVVGESGSAAEAIRRIPAVRPDVALVDVRLPDGSGIQVCRAVRSMDPRIRVLIVTSYDDEATRSEALLAGAAGFVLKEVRGHDLADAVRRVANGEDLLPPPVGPTRSSAPGMEELALSSLTPQERRVLDLIVTGLTNAQIGVRLGISEKTVRNHVTNVLAKLGFARRTQAAVFMARRGR